MQLRSNNMQQPKIKVDDVEYDLGELPENIQEAVYRYELWGKQEQEHKYEMEKANLARNQLNTHIVEQVREFNKELLKNLRQKSKDDSNQPPTESIQPTN